jgi:hypothetical protein
LKEIGGIAMIAGIAIIAKIVSIPVSFATLAWVREF